jgi:hypothetical protein
MMTKKNRWLQFTVAAVAIVLSAWYFLNRYTPSLKNARSESAVNDEASLNSNLPSQSKISSDSISTADQESKNRSLKPTGAAPVPTSKSRLPSAQAAGGKAGQGQISNRAEFLNKYPGPWFFEESNGRLTSASGVNIDGAGKTESSRLELISSLAPWLGVDANSIQAAKTDFGKTELTRGYHFDHAIEGISVYDSFASLIVKNQDDAVIMVSGNYKPTAQVDSTFLLSATDALRSLEESSDAKISLLKPASMIYFVDANEIAHKSWKILYKKTNVHWLAIVSGSDGSILVNHLAQAY